MFPNYGISTNADLTYTIFHHNALFVASIRDVSTGATGATVVAPKFSDTLTLCQPGGADSAHHRRGRP
jgi:hypothetical protein